MAEISSNQRLRHNTYRKMKLINNFKFNFDNIQYNVISDVPLHGKTKNPHRRNKGADQLCSYCTADQRFCLRNTDSSIRLLSESSISSL